MMECSLLYIDPGTGSMLFSILIALATTLAFGARVAWMKARFVITRGRKEKADSRNRGIVIYTDDKRYWNVFGHICREAERRAVDMVYMTQIADDPALTECKDFKHVKTEFIGEGNKGIAHMNFLVADVVLSSTPSLDVFQWKRSREVKWYVHVQHGTDDMLNYKMFALDFYDAVLLTGDFQTNYVRRMEKMRHIKAKELVTVGYQPMDEMRKRLEAALSASRDGGDENLGNKTVLVAPSWGKSAILSRYGEAFLTAVVSTGYHVIVRPHPQTVKTEKDVLDPLVKAFPASDMFEWNYDNDNFDCMNRADILITDFSGIIYDWALVFDKPLIYAGADFDPSTYDAAWFEGEKLWRFATLDKMGVELDEGQFSNMKEVIDSALSSDTLKDGRAQVRDEAWQHRGEAAQRIVDYLVEKQEEVKADKDISEKGEAA